MSIGPVNRATATLLLGYLSLAYGVIVALAFTPMILRILGAEAFGLVGIYLLGQACFQLLDAAVTPTASRETARFRGGASTPVEFRSSMKGLESALIALAIALTIFSLSFSEQLAQQWIQRETLSLREVSFSLAVMMLIMVARLLCGFRRGLLIGFERHGTLHAINILVASLRFPLLVLFISSFAASISLYFCYQLAISAIEALLLWRLSKPLMPQATPSPFKQCVRSLRLLLNHSMTHVGLALVWLVVTQSDKALLSKLLSLSQFGYFSLIVTAASGVALAATPITQMLGPRLAMLYAQSELDRFRATYHRYTKIVAVFTGTAAIVCALYGHELIFAWTGDTGLAERMGPVLAWYAAGNALMCLGGLPYFIQNALGTLRWHFYGSVVFMATIFPSLLWSVPRYGVLGAAITWTMVNLLQTLLWAPISHRTVMPGIHLRWLFDDILRVLIPTALVGFGLSHALHLPGDRLALGLCLAVIGIALLAVALISAGFLSVSNLRTMRLRELKRKIGGPEPSEDAPRQGG